MFEACVVDTFMQLFTHVGAYPGVLVFMKFAQSDLQSWHLQFFQGLTFKIGNVKRMSPASKAGLFKMDYLISVILDPSYCQWKWLNQYSCHLLIDQNSKLSLDKWTTSVQHDPRRDGQRNQNLRGHPTVGVRKVKTWTWHENNSFSENPMSLSKCKESFAILSLRGSFPRHKLTEPWHKHGTNNPTNSIRGLTWLDRIMTSGIISLTWA